jgi:hypothetical protein
VGLVAGLVIADDADADHAAVSHRGPELTKGFSGC